MVSHVVNLSQTTLKRMKPSGSISRCHRHDAHSPSSGITSTIPPYLMRPALQGKRSVAQSTLTRICQSYRHSLTTVSLRSQTFHKCGDSPPNRTRTRPLPDLKNCLLQFRARCVIAVGGANVDARAPRSLLQYLRFATYFLHNKMRTSSLEIF